MSIRAGISEDLCTTPKTHKLPTTTNSLCFVSLLASLNKVCKWLRSMPTTKESSGTLRPPTHLVKTSPSPFCGAEAPAAGTSDQYRTGCKTGCYARVPHADAL